MLNEPQQSSSQDGETPSEPRGLGGLPVVGEHRAMADVRLVARAVKRRWPVGPRQRRAVAEAMLGVVEQTRNDDDANALKVAAARVVVAMTAQNQADDHHADKIKQDDKHLVLDAARTLAGLDNTEKIAIIHRAGMGHLLPAELTTNPAPSAPQETPDARNSPTR